MLRQLQLQAQERPRATRRAARRVAGALSRRRARARRAEMLERAADAGRVRAPAADWSRGSALEAFKRLVTRCTELSRLVAGHPALGGRDPERYRRVAASLDLVTSLRIPRSYRAEHVRAGLEAQRDETCDELAAMLPPGRPASDGLEGGLWRHVARAAAARARETAEPGLAGRLRNVARVYGAGLQKIDGRRGA